MVNYARAFSQSESRKYFEWIIMLIISKRRRMTLKYNKLLKRCTPLPLKDCQLDKYHNLKTTRWGSAWYEDFNNCFVLHSIFSQMLSGGGQGGGSPGEQGEGGVWETGSLRWREAGEKFKKASFCYLLLLTSSQKNEPDNVSWLPFDVFRGLKQNFIPVSIKHGLRTADWV